MGFWYVVYIVSATIVIFTALSLVWVDRKGITPKHIGLGLLLTPLFAFVPILNIATAAVIVGAGIQLIWEDNDPTIWYNKPLKKSVEKEQTK